MARRSWLLLIFVLITILAFPAQRPISADAAQLTIEDLGAIDNAVPMPTGINASGQVSGYVIDASGTSRAVRFTDGAGWMYLTGPTDNSIATAINASGDVVGYRFTPSGSMRAFRYTDGGGVQDIAPLPGGSFTVGQGLNDSGDVVGYGDSSSGFVSWRASPGLPPVALPAPGGYEIACGINDAGQVTATALTSSGYLHAVRIEPDGSIVDARSFDGDAGMSQSGCAIADDGTFGGAATGDGLFRAFVFRHGVLTDVSGPLSASYGMISGVSHDAQVGTFMTADGSVRAFMHNDTDGSFDLNARLAPGSGWLLQQAVSINGKGQIVGLGERNGIARVFRLSSAPPPDRTPPTITSLFATPSSIVPPNRHMVPVTVAVTAIDDKDPSPACALAGVDAPNAPASDSAVTGPFSASVRAVGGRTYTLHMACTDSAGNSTSGTVDVVVPPDTTPPVINGVSATPSAIWPPDKRMVAVSVTVAATDDSDVAPTCAISRIAANEGSSSDYSITGAFSAMVRAWRLGTGRGRVYTLTVTCQDGAGNPATASASVTVAHDQR